MKAYPELSNISQLGLQGGHKGAFEPTYVNDVYSGSGTLRATAPDENSLKSVGLHELQHAIQHKEGFAKGGSKADFPEISPSEKANFQDLFDRQWDYVDTLKQGTREYDDANKELQRLSGVLMSPHDKYRSLAGEAEARATQARMGMDAAQRRATFPYDSYDVPANQLIVK
jgi:hypothetical protein